MAAKDTADAGKPKPDPTVKAEPAKDTEDTEAKDTEATEATNVRTPQDPFPDYDVMELGELRSRADAAGVGVPADLEKAALVAKLRQTPPEDESKREATGETEVAGPAAALPSYDLMTVDELRGLLPEGASVFTEDEERGLLVGQLRAVASGPTAAQSAQVGSNRPAESLPAPSGVSDKDQGRR